MPETAKPWRPRNKIIGGFESPHRSVGPDVSDYPGGKVIEVAGRRLLITFEFEETLKFLEILALFFAVHTTYFK